MSSFDHFSPPVSVASRAFLRPMKPGLQESQALAGGRNGSRDPQRAVLQLHRRHPHREADVCFAGWRFFGWLVVTGSHGGWRVRKNSAEDGGAKAGAIEAISKLWWDLRPGKSKKSKIASKILQTNLQKHKLLCEHSTYMT